MTMSKNRENLGSAPTQESQLYPDTDGKPMAVSDNHRRVLTRILQLLEQFFREDPDVYVSGDILMYYVQGRPPESRRPRCARLFRHWSEVAPDVSRLGGGKNPRFRDGDGE